MSNYTGGGRNHAKHRTREPGSRAPFATKNPFTSNGIVATRAHEKKGAPVVPNFDLKHARNASDQLAAGKGSAQVGNNRIDAVPSEFTPKSSTFTTPKAPSKSTLEALADLDDPRSRVLMRLNQPSFISLPPLKTRKPGPSVLKRRRDDDVSPIFSPPTGPIKRPKMTLSLATLPPSIEVENTDIQVLKLATEESIVCGEHKNSEHEGMEIGQVEEQERENTTPKPFQCGPAGTEDIFSWSPDPLESYEDHDRLNHSDEEDLFMPNESPSSNPFLTNRAGEPTSVDKAEGGSIMHPHFVEEYDGDSDPLINPSEGREGRTVVSPKKWLPYPASTIPMERLRLAGDRTGVGLPLKRWVGDGLELDHDEGLFSPVYHLDSDEEDGFEHSMALGWLTRLYEDHLQDNQADLSTAAPPPDTNDTVRSSEELWLHGFAEGDELVDAGSPSQQDEECTGIFISPPVTPIMRASPEEEAYGWELEDDVVQVVPIPVEDEEVFILAPTLFDFD